MKFVFVGYNYDAHYTSPEKWLERIKAYAGMLSCLSKNNKVTRIKQMNFEGERWHQGVTYHFVNFGKPSRFPRQLHRLVKSMHPDVVVVNGLHHPLQVIQLHRVLSKKTRIIAQNHAEKPFNGIKKLLQKIADRYIDAYLFASREMGLDWVKKGNLASAQKIHQVMEVSSVFYPVAREQAIAKTGVTGQAYLWVGRLNDNKDPLNVVKAFIDFAKQYPEARLYMIYHTDELLTRIKRLLDEKEMTHAVTLVGNVPNEELLYWYNSVDFIISGSHYEGSGTAVCEAMSCGCIPVITDIFSFRAMTDNGQCGILYPPGDRKALLSALIATTQMDVPAKKEQCLTFFQQNLSFEAIAQKIQDIAASL